MPYGTDGGHATTIIHVKLDEVKKLTLDFPEADEEDPADSRKSERDNAKCVWNRCEPGGGYLNLVVGKSTHVAHRDRTMVNENRDARPNSR